MGVSILWDSNRKYPRWLVRVCVGGNWYEVTNLADWRFWQDWWQQWKGARAWYLRRSVRHMVRWVEANEYIMRSMDALY